jgi:hypothetical protein
MGKKKNNPWNNFWKAVGKGYDKFIDSVSATDGGSGGNWNDQGKGNRGDQKKKEDDKKKKDDAAKIGAISATPLTPGTIIGDALTATTEAVTDFLGAPTEAQIDALKAQQDANDAKLAIDEEHAQALLKISLEQKALEFSEDTKAAERLATEYNTKAAQTQIIADQERITGKMAVGASLQNSANQSIQGNRDASIQATQIEREVSTAKARSGMSGVKQSGSLAVYTTQAKTAADEAKQNNINIVKSAVNNAINGTMSAQQQMDVNYQSQIFDKNAMLTKASEIRSSYAAGGQAYNLYQGNISALKQGVAADSLASTAYKDINNALLEKEQERLKKYKGYQMLSTTFQLAQAGINFAGSAISLFA